MHFVMGAAASAGSAVVAPHRCATGGMASSMASTTHRYPPSGFVAAVDGPAHSTMSQGRLRSVALDLEGTHSTERG